MFRKIEDFIPAWEYESEATLKIFRSLSDSACKEKITGYDRTLGYLAWHITGAVIQMGNKLGFNLYKVDTAIDYTENISGIIDIYTKLSESLVKEVQEKWHDDDLLVEQNLYGENWKNGNTLSIIIGHQAHHRAQMTVLMRILGLNVPGVYGPSKEEWAKMGMEAQK